MGCGPPARSRSAARGSDAQDPAGQGSAAHLPTIAAAAPHPIVPLIRRALAAAAQPERAAAQQAYMRSALPYYGIAVPQVRRIVTSLSREHRFVDGTDWRHAIATLWDGATHREEWYAALALARSAPDAGWVSDRNSLPLWEHMIRAGAWWDVCDEITEHLIAPMLAADPAAMTQVLRRWAHDPHLWIRRVAILSQNRARSRTDVALLVACLAGSLDDRDFFARKAVGWALREYSKTDPAWVLRYVTEQGDRLSGLSRREATRLLR